MTWSVEELVVRAYATCASGVQAVLDAVSTVERITRPPVGCIGCGKTGCGETCANAAYYRGAEELAVSPDGYYGYAEPNLRAPNGRLFPIADERGADFDEPVAEEFLRDGAQVAEPALTDDELVGVRGLLQERYGDQCTCPSWGNPSWPHRHGCPQISAATTETSAADSPAGVEHPPVPPVGHSEQRIHDVLIEHSRVAVSGTGGAARWGCRCDRTKALGPGGYIDHVLDLLNAEAPGPQEKPALETGHDMGVSFASELFPQHRNNK